MRRLRSREKAGGKSRGSLASRLQGPGPDDVDLRLSGSRVLLQRPNAEARRLERDQEGGEGNVEGDRLRGIGHIAGLCHAARLPPVPPLELDFNTDEGDGPVGLDSKVLNAAGVVQAKVRAQLCPRLPDLVPHRLVLA
eukprot:tig00000217_g19181.t1